MIASEPTVPLGRFDCSALTRKVLALDEAAWLADARRQNDYDVHAQTQSIILTFCEGWPDVRIFRAAGWDLLAEEAQDLMDRVIAKRYPPGGTVLRAIMARLPAGCRIARHTDGHPSFAAAHRIHVPLVTNPDVEFIVGSERIPPRAQYAFELNNLMAHSVANRGDAARIHFIFDYAPSLKAV